VREGYCFELLVWATGHADGITRADFT
jgi:hypothetical protein